MNFRIAVAVSLALSLAGPAHAADQSAIAPPTRELRVPVEGGSIYVRVNGDVAGPTPPVILIHGGPGGTHGGLLPGLALANNRAVILFDQLDSGASDRPNDRRNWTVERFVDQVEAVRRALNIQRWHIAGFSWGGTLALEYAARFPATTASVTLGSPLISTRRWIADALFLRSELPADVQAVLLACEAPAKPPKEQCDKAEATFAQRHLIRSPVPPAIRDYRVAGNKGFNPILYNHMWGPTEFAATGTLSNYDGEPLLRTIEGSKTLFITGQYDEARPETIIAYARGLSGSEVAIIPGAAHAMSIDRPIEWVAVLRAFLSRHDAPAPAN